MVCGCRHDCFQKTNSIRINPFKGLEDDETELEIGDIIDDATPIRNKRYRCDLLENGTCRDSLNEKLYHPMKKNLISYRIL